LLTPSQFCGLVYTPGFYLDAVLPLARLRCCGNGVLETQREAVAHGY
jgi:hypothetical protein